MPDTIRAVTAEEVRMVAGKYLTKIRSATGYLVKAGAPRTEKRS
jgi:zinc protease